jgi:Tol biopolymer transport system component
VPRLGLVRAATAMATLVILGACGSSAVGPKVTHTGPGALAASSDLGGVVTFNLDGTDIKIVTNAAGQMVKAAPSGTSVVFNNTGQLVDFGAPIYTANIATGTLGVVDTPVNSSGDAFPAFSRDGQWIYFSRYIAATNSGQLWRIHPDGTGGVALPNNMPGSDYWPTASPNGSQVAYVDIGSSHLRILTVASGAVTDLGITVHSPQWSPNSNLIAYVATSGIAGQIGVVRADGTGAHTLGAASYAWGIDWSPDGQWIAARNVSTSLIDLLNVSSGAVQTLFFTGTMGSPTWLSAGASH